MIRDSYCMLQNCVGGIHLLTATEILLYKTLCRSLPLGYKNNVQNVSKMF